MLLGPKGVGKTSIAVAMINELRTAGTNVMFVTTAELSSMMGTQYKADDIRAKLVDVERAMKEVDVLVLDDFGTEGGMQSDIKPVRKDMQELMYRVANARFDLDTNAVCKSTIITTNNTQQQLETMYNDKLISRLVPKDKQHRLAFNAMNEVRRV